MSKLDDFITKNKAFLDANGSDSIGGQIVAGLQELALAVKEELEGTKPL